MMDFGIIQDRKISIAVVTVLFYAKDSISKDTF